MKNLNQDDCKVLAIDLKIGENGEVECWERDFLIADPEDQGAVIAAALHITLTYEEQIGWYRKLSSINGLPINDEYQQAILFGAKQYNTQFYTNQ